MPDKIAILKESGEQLNSNIVSVFLIPETNKKYIITTENAVDPHGLNILHVSEINGEELVKIATEQEWLTIKNIMRAIISGNVGPYQYELPIEQAKVNGQYYRDISVSSTASKQMTDNYMADVAKKQEEAKKAAKEAKEREEAEVRKNPETESLNSLASAEPIMPAAPEPVVAPQATAEAAKVEEAPKAPEPVVATEVAKAPEPVAEPVAEPKTEAPAKPIEPSTIFPADDTKIKDEASLTPGIAEVGEGEEFPKEEPTIELTTNYDVPTPEEKVEEPEVPAAQATVIEPNNAEVTPAQAVDVVESSSSQGNKVTIDFNVPSSFSPDATLDEVLVGAQEVFMEGVKNLIQTMTEKLYRDFYDKEKRLKEREDLLLQREKLLNDQIALINKQFDNK